MGKVMFMRKGDLHTAPSAGIPAGELAVGSSIWLNENGVPAEYIVVNQGIPSGSTLYDSSCDGTWLLRKDLYEARAWDSNSTNDYKNGNIHSVLNSTFLSLFDIHIQESIKQVKIPYQDGSSISGTTKYGENGLETKIFLLSGYEMGWTQNTFSNFIIDGACLSYFSDCSETDSKRIAYLNGTATAWWLRSPSTYNSGYVFVVLTSGRWNHIASTHERGIRPALILSSDMKIDESMIVGGAS